MKLRAPFVFEHVVPTLAGCSSVLAIRSTRGPPMSGTCVSRIRAARAWDQTHTRPTKLTPQHISADMTRSLDLCSRTRRGASHTSPTTFGLHRGAHWLANSSSPTDSKGACEPTLFALKVEDPVSPLGVGDGRVRVELPAAHHGDPNRRPRPPVHLDKPVNPSARDGGGGCRRWGGVGGEGGQQQQETLAHKPKASEGTRERAPC